VEIFAWVLLLYFAVAMVVTTGVRALERLLLRRRGGRV
jgi:hypothetical protein